MPSQRDPNKKLISCWMQLGLVAGIETWLKLKKNAGKDRTDFLIEASLLHLKTEGITVEMPVEVAKGRPRSVPQEAYALVSQKTNSSPGRSANTVARKVPLLHGLEEALNRSLKKRK